MTSAPADPAERHAHDAARFTELVESASRRRLGPPQPGPRLDGRSTSWTHLVDWSRGFLTGAGIELPALDVAADPVAAWEQHVADIQAVLDDPAGRVLSNPHTGDRPVDEAIDQFYTGDVWMHSWDLAMALGREPDLGGSAAAPHWRPWSRSSSCCATAGSSAPPCPSPPTPPRRTSSSPSSAATRPGSPPAWSRARRVSPPPGRAAACSVRVVLEEGISSSAVPATCSGTTDTVQSGRRSSRSTARCHAARAVSGPKQASSPVALDLDLDQPGVGQVRGEFLNSGSAPSSGWERRPARGR